MVKSVLNNNKSAARDIVLLNAGAAIYAANLTDTLTAGIEKARQVIASGEAKAKLNTLIAYSQKF
jgi:anthranilate phosphoribosyltransferase